MRLTLVILLLIIASLFLSGCGNQGEPVSAEEIERALTALYSEGSTVRWNAIACESAQIDTPREPFPEHYVECEFSGDLVVCEYYQGPNASVNNVGNFSFAKQYGEACFNPYDNPFCC